MAAMYLPCGYRGPSNGPYSKVSQAHHQGVRSEAEQLGLEQAPTQDAGAASSNLMHNATMVIL